VSVPCYVARVDDINEVELIYVGIHVDSCSGINTVSRGWVAKHGLEGDIYEDAPTPVVMGNDQTTLFTEYIDLVLFFSEQASATVRFAVSDATPVDLLLGTPEFGEDRLGVTIDFCAKAVSFACLDGLEVPFEGCDETAQLMQGIVDTTEEMLAGGDYLC